MSLLDWMQGVRATPGFGSGLLGGNWSSDKDQNSDIKRAGLMAALGMFSNVGNGGNFLQGVGKAAEYGLGSFASAPEGRRQQEMRDFQMSEMRRQAQRQQEQDERQRRMDNLPQQFMRLPPTMDAGDIGTPGAAQPQLDKPAYLQALWGVDPMRAMQMEASLRKERPQPVKLGQGDQLLDPETYAVMASNQKPDAAEKAPEAIRAIEAVYGANSPEAMKAKRDYITKMSTHQPGVSVSYGAPVAGQDAQGNPVFFQPGKDGRAPSIVQGVTPPAKEVPASTKKEIAENKVALGKVSEAIQLLDANEEALGLQNIMGDTIMQRIDPKGVDVRAAVADIGSQKIHDRSGANVTISEAPRLKPFIPSAMDSPKAARKKLKRLEAEYEAMIGELQAGAGIKDASAARAPAASTNMSRLSPAEQAELAELRRRFPNRGQ